MEAGLKDYEVLSWNGLSVPAATPKPVIDTLVKGLNDVLPDPVASRSGRRRSAWTCTAARRPRWTSA